MPKNITVHCLKHVPFEGPGMIADYLEENNITLNTIKLYAGQPLPDMDSVDFLIVMGGPMDIDDEQEYSWLFKEKELIKKMIAAGKPVLGICLGAQMIACVLGQPIYPAENQEIGWFPVKLTKEGKTHPLTKDWNDNPTVFHWHSNTFDLPNDVVHLASTETCSNQAFVYNRNVIGLQFHLEISEEHVQVMIDNWGRYKNEGKWIQQPETMIAKSDAAKQTREMLYCLLDYWFGTKNY